MAHHEFSFEHGDIMSHIGAAWYASYAYYRHCDPAHENYKNVGTWKTRASTYKRHLELEKYFMEQIAQMSPERLVKNTIGLSGEDILRMARDVGNALK